MTAASRDNIPIRKHNVIAYYSRAREKAFTLKTIKNSFRKTGIWPIDPNVIEDDAFAPALNTTTEAAQPVPASIPECVVVVPSKAPTSTPDASPVVSVATTSSDGTTATDTVTFTIKVLKKLGPRATVEALRKQNDKLRYLLDQACYQMQKDHAFKKLMDSENERLRKQLYNRQNKPKKKQATGFARHMTSEENLVALAREEWQAAMKEVFKNPVFKERREKYDRYCKEIAAKEKEREREEARAMREAARLQVRMEKSLAQEARKHERENLKAIRDEEK